MARVVAGAVTGGVWEARVLPGSVARLRQGYLVWVKTLHQGVAKRGVHGFPVTQGFRATSDCLLVGGLSPLLCSCSPFLFTQPFYLFTLSLY